MMAVLPAVGGVVIGFLSFVVACFSQTMEIEGNTRAANWLIVFSLALSTVAASLFVHAGMVLVEVS